jgi:protein-S-isoprenylcysteine O-methyltransferase Ste14
MIGMPLLLGSWLGLLVLPLILGALSVRIFIEEAALRKGIPGYGDYVARVRYRCRMVAVECTGVGPRARL